MNPLKLDPTRTTMLRKRFVVEMRRRFYELRSKVIQAIWKLDALGLVEKEPMTFNTTFVVHQLPGKQAWRFKTSAEKLDSFNAWVKQQVDEGILTTDVKGNPWTSKYIGSAYKQGSLRAYQDTHKEDLLQKPEWYQGRRSQFLESAFNQPERLSKLKFLYTRTYEELKGITAAMSQGMSRILANGLSHGKGPASIARDLSKNITGITKRRAEVLARTEVIAAHAEGQLDSFTDLGVKDVGVMAEWSTAEDDRVCPQCENLNGTIMTVDEARGLIPLHPNCRCAWIPADVGEEKKVRKPII